jgi:hypothetical protein
VIRPALDRLVRVGQGERLDVRHDRHLRGQGEELLAVLPRQVGDRADGPLLPEELVRERGDVAHVDPGADDDAAAVERAQGRWNQSADGREDDRRVQRLGRQLVRGARPLDAERARQLLALRVARPGEREHAPPLVPRDLRDDVRRGAEAVEPEPLAVAREPERAIADQPGAEERRELQRRVVLRQPEAVARVGNRKLRVAAVQVVAGEAGAQAEVLAAAAAEAAVAVRPAEPGDADALAGLELHPFTRGVHDSDDLMAEDERQLRFGQLAVDDVQVGPADAAGLDANANLAVPGLGVRQLHLLQRPAGNVEHQRTHGTRVRLRQPRSVRSRLQEEPWSRSATRATRCSSTSTTRTEISTA